ncbi:uridine kinase family protein [Demequina sediminicola]|uniref:uridine kinase family protein n=1 Tax=Demequina sediminicola TaxID=1095026 RepID=UPI0007810FB4|nr:hypothetical protein [Demequina sediminicola]
MTNPSIAQIVEQASVRRALAGRTRVILIDGPAGSGKTTLANTIAIALGGRASEGAGTFSPDNLPAASSPTQILHGDDMYEGWSGLDALDDVLVQQVLTPLADGHSGAFRMWDWHVDRRTHHIAVPPRDFLVVEGVGVGRESARDLGALVLWVEAPADVRLARGIERDGEQMRAEWLSWMDTERAHFIADHTRDHAHMLIDGTLPIPTRPVPSR